MKKIFILIVLLLCVLPVHGQLKGKITVVSVPDRYKISNKGQSTTGLRSVGVGQRVVLSPMVFGRAGGSNYNDTLVAVTSAIWSFTSTPAGSAAVIADTGDASGIVYFIPDSIGTYVVSMFATTPIGTAGAGSITINAGKFVGAGISAPSTNGVPNACKNCHQGTLAQQFTDLLTTNHSQAVKWDVNLTGGHFSPTCMPCHSIGYDGVTTSHNNGWDDLAAGADSTYKKWFPPLHPNGPGTFDSLVANNPVLMARAGIQCENCHGAASEHSITGDKTKLDVTLSSSVCQPCHYSSDRHGIGYQWQASAHARSASEGSSVQALDRFTCARCHLAQGYVNEVIGGKAQPKATGSAIVYADPQPVGCSTCHDPHTNNVLTIDPATGSYAFPQLRAPSIGDVCTGCHVTRLSSRGGIHTSNQGPMLLGTDAAPMTLAIVDAYRSNSTIMANNVGTWSGWELPGYTYQNSSHSTMKDRCVPCHMAKSPTYIANEASGFTIGDSLLTKLGRHTFMVAYTTPGGTTILNPTGCVDCHGTVAIEFVESTRAKTQALLDALYTVLPKRDSTISVADGYTSGSPISPTDTIAWQNAKAPASAKRTLTVAERAAAYNFIFAKNDGSGGVHNFLYTKGLLESSIEQVKLGLGAATIAQIKDVPLDNGCAVQVVWNKFPAESFSYGRLTSYGVWRRDPMMPSLGKAFNPLQSFTQMLRAGTVGGQYTFGASVWTFVGMVPISSQGQYSFIAPTLFDSTKTGGAKYSAFFIAGNTSDGSNTVYQSPIDSGYSVNNLSPSVILGVTGTSTTKGVALAWNRSSMPQDNDIASYSIYRSTTSGFTPDPAAPYATAVQAAFLDSVVTNGATYYYRINAFDKAGNAGPYSDQFTMKVTSVDRVSMEPATFALDQNFPNPFNPSTQIRFALPSQTYVQLNVYSISGELVRALVNTTMPGGVYRAEWNGTGDDGRTVSTGVYICRIQAGTNVAAKKMLFVK